LKELDGALPSGYISVTERELTELVAYRLSSAGFTVYRNIVVGGVEIDVLALERGYDVTSVYIVEVKRRPRIKVYRQLMRRAELADYLFIAIPYMFYAWALRKIDTYVGIMVIKDREVYVLRNAKYLGNGDKLLKLMLREYCGNAFTPRDVANYCPPLSADTRESGLGEAETVGRVNNTFSAFSGTATDSRFGNKVSKCEVCYQGNDGG